MARASRLSGEVDPEEQEIESLLKERQCNTNHLVSMLDYKFLVYIKVIYYPSSVRYVIVTLLYLGNCERSGNPFSFYIPGWDRGS